MKTCSKCGEIKDYTEYYTQIRCKDGLYSYCKTCKKKQMLNNYKNDKDAYLERSNKWKTENPEKHKANVRKCSKKYYATEVGRDKMIASAIRYQRNNREKVNDVNRKNRRKRYHNDPNFKLISLLRGRIRMAIKNNSKSNSSKQLIGCSIQNLKIHLQKSAIDNGYLDFNIEDYSGQDYHIDHIIPCASFDMSKEEQQRECFHYSNLQILTATENMKKGDKIVVL